MRKIIFIVLLLVVNIMAFANQNGFEGYWMMPDGKFIIKIDKQPNNEYIGHVVWLKMKYYPKGDKEEGIEQHDRNNKNSELKTRKVIGLQVVGNLYEKNGKLQGGYIYDSWNGRQYYGSAKLEDQNTLLLRGSFDKIGILGLTQKAVRVLDLAAYGLKD